MKIEPNDIEWVRKYYAGLRVKSSDGVIRGILRFRAKKVTSMKVTVYHSFPSEKQKSKPSYIEDSYDISLSFDEQGLPHVRETGGRLERRARKIGVELADMHIHGSGEACLGSNLTVISKMKQINTLEEFFEDLLIPYFYYHSYWEKHGKMPWSGRPHGNDLVIFLEDLPKYQAALTDDDMLNLVAGMDIDWHIFGHKMTRNTRCFCNSGNKIKYCHLESMKGFNILRKWVRSKQH